MAVRRYGHWIGGAEVAALDGRTIVSTRPGLGEAVCEIADGGAGDVDAAVGAARAALARWRDAGPGVRGRLLLALAAAIRGAADRLAELEAAETGKPLANAAAEVEVAAQYYEFYGGLARGPAGEVVDLGSKYHAYVRREPFGVVGAITPWNAPLNQASRGIAPALAAGNVVVAKPSEHTSATTLELARLATEAGLPDGVLNVVTGLGATAGAALTEHPGVRKLVFTGSVRAGREVGRVAAERIIPVTLELGGKSPNIIFADADLDAAVAGAVGAFVANAGQVCSGGTRLLVHEDVHDAVVERLVEALRGVVPGEAYGPQTTQDQFDRVVATLESTPGTGATLAAGGRATGEGWLVEPTVYTDVTNDMPIARDEVFGPVLAVLRFATDDEAVAIANDSPYGLAAGLWTRDLARAHRVAAELEAGQVYVNEWKSSVMEGPFGGFKESGIGREKGLEALHHYTQSKFVVVAL